MGIEWEKRGDEWVLLGEDWSAAVMPPVVKCARVACRFRVGTDGNDDCIMREVRGMTRGFFLPQEAVTAAKQAVEAELRLRGLLGDDCDDVGAVVSDTTREDLEWAADVVHDLAVQIRDGTIDPDNQFDPAELLSLSWRLRDIVTGPSPVFAVVDTRQTPTSYLRFLDAAGMLEALNEAGDLPDGVCVYGLCAADVETIHDMGGDVKARTKPAVFDVRGPDGRSWRVRVGPLGIEAISHRTYDRDAIGWGDERHAVPWSSILPHQGEKR